MVWKYNCWAYKFIHGLFHLNDWVSMLFIISWICYCWSEIYFLISTDLNVSVFITNRNSWFSYRSSSAEHFLILFDFGCKMTLSLNEVLLTAGHGLVCALPIFSVLDFLSISIAIAANFGVSVPSKSSSFF